MIKHAVRFIGCGSANPGIWGRSWGIESHEDAALILEQTAADAVLIHLPFARSMTPDGPEQPMDADGAVEVREAYELGNIPPWAGLHPRDFTRDWSRALAWEPNKRIMVYNGDMHDDPDFAGLDRERYVKRSLESFKPALEVCFGGHIARARVGLGFDSIGVDASTQDSIPYQMMLSLGLLGHPCYVEPIPFPEQTWMHRFHTVSLASAWFGHHRRQKTKGVMAEREHWVIVGSQATERTDIDRLMDDPHCTHIVCRSEKGVKYAMNKGAK